MRALLEDPENIIIPFDSTFLGYVPVMENFRIADEKLTDSIGTIVFTGSSSIRMWETLATDFDTLPYQILNRGFGGSILPQVNYFFDDLITPHQPEIVVLYCGENDVTNGYLASDVLESFRTFLRLVLYKSPKSKVLYVSMKPSPARWEVWPEFEKGNQMIEGLIRRLNNPNIQYFDIAPTMLDSVNQYPIEEIFTSDSLHLNAAGYARWQEALLPKISQIDCNEE
jgi:lysophospholipase L1-like esterase